jgi:hypothetical protein
VEVGEEYAVVFRIGEPLVAPASAGELGVEVDAVADIADDEEGRAALLRRQGGDVATCLVVGAFEGFIKGRGAALAMAGLGGGGLGGEFVRSGIGGESLLGFVDEMARPENTPSKILPLIEEPKKEEKKTDPENTSSKISVKNGPFAKLKNYNTVSSKVEANNTEDKKEDKKDFNTKLITTKDMKLSL